METFILVIWDSGRHMYIRWCKWSLKRALKSLDFVQDTALQGYAIKAFENHKWILW